jgi:hypothetical protein
MSVECRYILYLLPFVPILSRCALIARFHATCNEVLNEQRHDREAFRAHLLAFAGYSFVGVSAFAIVESQLKTGLAVAIYELLVSFFAYMFSLNLVKYKARYVDDQLATMFEEVGTLALFLSIVATLIATKSGTVWVMGAFAALVWGIDHSYRLQLDWKHQTAREKLRSSKQ